MIPEAEIRREAARLGVDLMVVDLDYALGCFLATLFRQAEGSALCFKGGTCLKKCYHGDYRFSEDLDFTLMRRMTRNEVEKLISAVVARAADEWEIDFQARPPRVEVVDDEYGKESYQVRLYFHGPLRRRGDPRAVRLDFTTNEVVAFPVDLRPIIHAYSDAGMLTDVRVPCYDPLEMVAEKLRALAGQRKYAISRDIYDLHYLAHIHHHEALNIQRLIEALPAKWQAKGLAVEPPNVERLAERREEFREDWERNLRHLLPSEAVSDFDEAWRGTSLFLKEVRRVWLGQ